jgi:hypothetical protein
VFPARYGVKFCIQCGQILCLKVREGRGTGTSLVCLLNEMLESKQIAKQLSSRCSLFIVCKLFVVLPSGKCFKHLPHTRTEETNKQRPT